MKKCRICQQIKPYSHFHIQTNNKDGYRTECKLCKNSQQREYKRKNRKKVLLGKKIDI